jgi:uncharacterized GH25 family protein
MLKKLCKIACISLLNFNMMVHDGAAHDTWVEAGPLVQPTGEYAYVQLMLGNHGNNHRDFKLASKITLAPCALQVMTPSGVSLDLKPQLVDMGYAEKEGYWTARYEIRETGIHEVLHTLDTLHGTIRAIKSAKTFILAQSEGQGQSTASDRSDTIHGLGLELVLLTPLANLTMGQEFKVQVLRAGQPLQGARVAFIPRGARLAEEFDNNFERESDRQGIVVFKPAEGNIVLVIVHQSAPEESGEGYSSTHYSAAMVLPIRNQKIADFSKP